MRELPCGFFSLATSPITPGLVIQFRTEHSSMALPNVLLACYSFSIYLSSIVRSHFNKDLSLVLVISLLQIPSSFHQLPCPFFLFFLNTCHEA
ncbi:hypothetical protein L873DRAFT_1205656 [Choiromyces venosus 120613-1]|uniref:Uncharacterized protein n=1 Tax=Choiromyces venosus 120613-1 TaxID=1336337 RepID=A0A3N4JEF8_9PEZI|nr:hypothetical protein L873DRAFT_1205656 [Choiromyces venosus 120613-1]